MYRSKVSRGTRFSTSPPSREPKTCATSSLDGTEPTSRANAHVNPWRSRVFSVACASNVREMRSTAFSVGIDTVVPEP